MRLTGLFIYPVKALRGLTVTEAAVDALGLVGDRRFLIVNEHGQFLTQRLLPRMALVETALDDTTLTLRAAGAGEIRVGRAPDPAAPRRSVCVWSSEGLQTEDCGDAPAAWLGDFLGLHCRLVRIGADFNRPVKPGKARPGDVVSFADSHPFLLISEASLADLNDRMIARDEPALPMNRFRPNLVVDGCPAFAEDGWKTLRIGAVAFRAAGPCARCVVTATNQLTAERHKEPLRTLATYRRDPQEPASVNFGQNLIHETKAGRLHLGDAVEISA